MVMQMHDLAVGAGWVSAPEFWKMKPGQFWWLYRSKMPKTVRTMPDEIAEIRQMVKDAKAKESEES